jgi:MFS family permease
VTRRPGGAGLLTATGLSVTANAMVAVLVPWLVIDQTGSAAKAGLVGAVALAVAVPALLLGGPVIDRWGRRRVATFADLLSAVSVAALPLVDATVGLSLVTTLALVGLGAVFDGPGGAAREASRPSVATAAGLPLHVLNSRGEALEGLGGIAGPALAGAGLAAVGATGSLWVAAVLFLVAALVTWRRLPSDVVPTAGSESLTRAALSGLRAVWGDRTLRAVALLGASAMAFYAPLTLVLIAHLAPQGRAAALGTVSASLAGGAVVGALVYGAVADRAVSYGVGGRAVLVVALTAAAAGFGAMATLPSVPVLAVIAGITGLAVGPVNPVLAGLTQSRTTEGMRGRVVSVTWSLSLVAAPLGMLGAGLLLDESGATVTMAVIALGRARDRALRRPGARATTACSHRRRGTVSL